MVAAASAAVVLAALPAYATLAFHAPCTADHAILAIVLAAVTLAAIVLTAVTLAAVTLAAVTLVAVTLAAVTLAAGVGLWWLRSTLVPTSCVLSASQSPITLAAATLAATSLITTSLAAVTPPPTASLAAAHTCALG